MKIASLIIQDTPVIAAFVEGDLFDLTSANPSLGQHVGELLAQDNWRERAEEALKSAAAIDVC